MIGLLLQPQQAATYSLWWFIWQSWQFNMLRCHENIHEYGSQKKVSYEALYWYQYHFKGTSIGTNIFLSDTQT